MTDNQLTVIDRNLPEITPMGMLQTAIERGASIESMTALMALQERWEANEARKAYAKAVSAFRSEGLSVSKDNTVRYKTDKGITEYTHATLGAICSAINPALAAHELSFRWETMQEEAKIKVTCILMHSLGHSERTSLSSGADTSGGKNNIQAIGSTVAYLQRYTLLAITGTSTKDADDDGQSSESQNGISQEQVAAESKKRELPPCTDVKFNALMADKVDPETGEILTTGRKKLITSGERTADEIIAAISTKYKLSAEQSATIKKLEKTA